VRQLLQHTGGRGLDEGDDEGCTALWGACIKGHVEVARCLLLAGADHTIADTDGETPRQVAERFGDSACVPMLEVSGPLY
jgi:ankyrin repeat protein